MFMQRLKCTVAYDGTGYFGYQIQPNHRTIQEEIEKALKKLHKGLEIKIYASGRTDAGVHAKGQVIHFDTNLDIPEEKWPIALNSILPGDISILSAKRVDENFHARFDVTGKEYRYFINPSSQKDPFTRNYAASYPYELHFKAIQSAMTHLIGTHDFTSFCSAKTEVEDKIRTIYNMEIQEDNGLIVFKYIGNGFLYNMVRILTGTLLDVGTGKRTPDSIAAVLEKKDRTLAGKTAPAHGLYLWEVFY
jgi:tRNA pseudouridine38-40 synthase